MTASGAAARARAAVRKAVEAAVREIGDDRDRAAAVLAAHALAEGMREAYFDTTDFRARLVVAIIDAGHLTREEVAVALGVSRRRVNQLYRAGRG
ncbi:hypothetical protein [Tenggerimyces flavus]|uniref:Uncharacterized protein n=1 Tax=Tenggerimyces flavus TaxID=1708749 RepID=A0ABV7YBM3_9ACTN|nr:hypothetical protein [Tenggerimyces flavus]MBM7788841.1 ParB-like chromosome segregation protein Spo0J [Tenggerimyces flavus]